MTTSVDQRQLWQAALGELQLQMSRPNYETWFKDTTLVDVEGDVCVIAVPNPFTREWLETRCVTLIRKTLQGIAGRSMDVRFVLKGPEPTVPNPGGPLLGLVTEESEDSSTRRGRRPAVASSMPLNPKYSFAEFVVGNGNRLAHAACLAVADNPGHAYNPP